MKLIYSAKTVKENINGGAPKNATGSNNAPIYSSDPSTTFIQLEPPPPTLPLNSTNAT